MIYIYIYASEGTEPGQGHQLESVALRGSFVHESISFVANAPVKISTGHTHTHRQRTTPPITTHTHAHDENNTPNEHLPQTLNNARRCRDDVFMWVLHTPPIPPPALTIHSSIARIFCARVYIMCGKRSCDTYDSDANAAAYGGDELCAHEATVPPDPYSLDYPPPPRSVPWACARVPCDL